MPAAAAADGNASKRADTRGRLFVALAE